MGDVPGVHTHKEGTVSSRACSLVGNSGCIHIKRQSWGAWLAQSVERATLDLRVVSLSPTLGEEIT